MNDEGTRKHNTRSGLCKRGIIYRATGRRTDKPSGRPTGATERTRLNTIRKNKTKTTHTPLSHATSLPRMGCLFVLSPRGRRLFRACQTVGAAGSAQRVHATQTTLAVQTRAARRSIAGSATNQQHHHQSLIGRLVKPAHLWLIVSAWLVSRRRRRHRFSCILFTIHHNYRERSLDRRR